MSCGIGVVRPVMLVSVPRVPVSHSDSRGITDHTGQTSLIVHEQLPNSRCVTDRTFARRYPSQDPIGDLHASADGSEVQVSRYRFPFSSPTACTRPANHKTTLSWFNDHRWLKPYVDGSGTGWRTELVDSDGGSAESHPSARLSGPHAI
jgi:hypothetical protein